MSYSASAVPAWLAAVGAALGVAALGVAALGVAVAAAANPSSTGRVRLNGSLGHPVTA